MHCCTPTLRLPGLLPGAETDAYTITVYTSCDNGAGSGASIQVYLQDARWGGGHGRGRPALCLPQGLKPTDVTSSRRPAPPRVSHSPQRAQAHVHIMCMCRMHMPGRRHMTYAHITCAHHSNNLALQPASLSLTSHQAAVGGCSPITSVCTSVLQRPQDRHICLEGGLQHGQLAAVEQAV